PAGNLGGSAKHAVYTIPPSASSTIAIDASMTMWAFSYQSMELTLLWRDPAANLAFMIRDPSGVRHPLRAGDTAGTPWSDHNTVSFSDREDSARHTAMFDALIMGSAMPLASGHWFLVVRNPSPRPVQLQT